MVNIMVYCHDFRSDTHGQCQLSNPRIFHGIPMVSSPSATMWGPPVMSVGWPKPHEYILVRYLRIINHSELLELFARTNLASYRGHGGPCSQESSSHLRSVVDGCVDSGHWGTSGWGHDDLKTWWICKEKGLINVDSLRVFHGQFLGIVLK